jgi:hypothetical protein
MVNISVMAAPVTGARGVGDEQDQRPPAVVPVQRGDGVGIEPVGEVVAEHGDRHHGPDGAAGLEPGPDGQAVHQAVPDQRGRGKDAKAWGVTVACVLALLTFVAAVDRHRALDDVQGQEAEDRGEHGQGNAEQLAGLLGECFGYQVEADDPEHQPGGEPEDEVLLVVEPQGGEAPGQGGEE